MTFIDWSDSEGMFGLLLDFIADESAECRKDAERQRFLEALFARLGTTDGRWAETSPAVLVRRLRDAQESVDPEFLDDPAMVHLRDCIEELERVERESTDSASSTR